MNEAQLAAVSDRETFARVWRRVMPEDRDDCPFTLDPPSLSTRPLPAPARSGVCLGEDSVGQLPVLDQLLTNTIAGYYAYRAMPHRSGLPTTLAQAKRRQTKRLAAARFLIAGEPLRAAAADRRRPISLAAAVRARYQAEQRLALDFLTAANASSDPCLIDLYRALAIEDQTYAGQLREWLERM